MVMDTCENCGDHETLHYVEWNHGNECGELCEVCAEMFYNMEEEEWEE